MNIVDFQLKYGMSLKGFFDIYLNRWKENPNLVKIWNPIKLLKICYDLPLKTLDEEYPVEYRVLTHLMNALEERIEDLKIVNPNYYKFQIEPLL